MEYFTLDDLIGRLHAMKVDGVPGDTPVAIPSRDNNGRNGYVKRVDGAHISKIAKSDLDKGYEVCRSVYSRGVNILMIG